MPSLPREVEVEARADAALNNYRQGTKFTFDCPSDSFEIGVSLVAVKSFSRQD
jgi:hypothetical protein